MPSRRGQRYALIFLVTLTTFLAAFSVYSVFLLLQGGPDLLRTTLLVFGTIGFAVIVYFVYVKYYKYPTRPGQSFSPT